MRVGVRRAGEFQMQEPVQALIGRPGQCGPGRAAVGARPKVSHGKEHRRSGHDGQGDCGEYPARRPPEPSQAADIGVGMRRQTGKGGSAGQPGSIQRDRPVAPALRHETVYHGANGLQAADEARAHHEPLPPQFHWKTSEPRHDGTATMYRACMHRRAPASSCFREANEHGLALSTKAD
jgi:hypothetical protein